MMDLECPLSRVERTRPESRRMSAFEPVAYFGLDPHLARSGRFSLASPRQSATICVQSRGSNDPRKLIVLVDASAQIVRTKKKRMLSPPAQGRTATCSTKPRTEK